MRRLLFGGGSGSSVGTLPAGMNETFGERTVNLGTFAAGRYVIGFGVGAANTNANNIAFAVTNILSPAGIPEIDTKSASLPMSLVLLGFLVVIDRRRARQSSDGKLAA